MRTWIKSPLAIHAGPGESANNGLVVEDDEIVELVSAGGTPGSPPDRIFDASDHVVLPGLVNTHHHYYQTLTRAVPAALNQELFSWLKSLYPIWAGLTDEMIYLSTRLACAELLLSGCTTSADHHYLFGRSMVRPLDSQAQALTESGIRAVLTRGSMSLGQDDGGLPPQSVVQDADTILADCEDVISRFHDPGTGSMLQVALAPCSPFSVSRELMADTALLARNRGVRLHTHLAETEDETAFCQSRFGCRPLAYLEEVGWLDDDVWLAHGIHFNQSEIRKLGEAGTGIAHCPSSNMLLGSGTCPVLDLQAAGSPVGLAVDGSASNDCSNMIQELRQALLQQRLKYGSSRVSHEQVLDIATEGSAACLGRDDIGVIAPGRQADLALFKPDELRFSGCGDPLAALVLSGAHAADHVMVGGLWKVTDGELVDGDIDKLQQSHREAARNLLRDCS